MDGRGDRGRKGKEDRVWVGSKDRSIGEMGVVWHMYGEDIVL